MNMITQFPRRLQPYMGCADIATNSSGHHICNIDELYDMEKDPLESRKSANSTTGSSISDLRKYRRNLHAACIFQDLEETARIRIDLLVLLAENKISISRGPSPVVQFVDVPNTIVADELVTISAQRVHGRGLREIAFPVVFIEQFLRHCTGLACASGSQLAPSQ